MSVCLCVPSRNTRIPVDWRLLVKEHIANIGIPLEFFWVFVVLMVFVVVLNFFCGYLQTILLCKGASRGRVSVVSDR